MDGVGGAVKPPTYPVEDQGCPALSGFPSSRVSGAYVDVEDLIQFERRTFLELNDARCYEKVCRQVEQVVE
jgi:hypothetical protein